MDSIISTFHIDWKIIIAQANICGLGSEKIICPKENTNNAEKKLILYELEITFVNIKILVINNNDINGTYNIHNLSTGKLIVIEMIAMM